VADGRDGVQCAVAVLYPVSDSLFCRDDSTCYLLFPS
jgi:hypothetical protein